MRISVALAYYNGGKYIEKQVYSILGQLGDEDELIISIDDAADGSMELLERLADQDGKIRLLTGPGQGVVKTSSMPSLPAGEISFSFPIRMISGRRIR